MKRYVRIVQDEKDITNCFRVELVNTLNEVVATYTYFNYFNFIGNGDMLARVCSEWINFGIFPGNPNEFGRGLVKIG